MAVQPMRLIVNPVAGHGRAAKLWPRLRDELHAEGAEFDVLTTPQNWPAKPWPTAAA